jgi:hypothetical protein
MKALHIALGYSAGTSLSQAIRDAGWDEEVLRFGDVLSCEPIDSDEVRTIWGASIMLTRVVSLVNAGKLLADGDPWEMSSRVRLPG